MTNKAAPAIAGTAADQAGGDLTSKNDFQLERERELGRDLDRLVELGLVELAGDRVQLTAAGHVLGARALGRRP